MFKPPFINYDFHVVMLFRTVYLFQLNTTTSVLLMVVLFLKNADETVRNNVTTWIGPDRGLWIGLVGIGIDVSRPD